MRFIFTASLALALTSTATLSSAASKTAAQQASPRAPENPDATSAQDAIDRELIAPLADKEGGQAVYSRAYVPPHDRTARILDAHPRADADGKRFLTFAVDETRPGGKVRKDTITGCVYPDDGKVFVGRGGEFFPAALLLGKKVDAAPAACKADDASASRAAAPLTGWLASLRAKL